MGERESLDYFLNEVFKLLKKAGFTVNAISYPKDKRSVDLIGSRNKTKVVLKITLDTKNLSRIEFSDLKKISKAFRASPLIISERDENEKLEKDLVVKSKGINVVSIELLQSYLLRGEKPIVYKLRGNLLVKIDPVKFREIRLQHGYSLGELAEKIGVSRKAIYEYERGQIAISVDRAIRITEILGEDILKPIEILDFDEDFCSINSDIRSKNIVSKIISEICSEINISECLLYKLGKTPIDYILKIGGKNYSIIFETNDFNEKIGNALKITTILNSREIIVRQRSELLELKKEIS